MRYLILYLLIGVLVLIFELITSIVKREDIDSGIRDVYDAILPNPKMIPYNIFYVAFIVIVILLWPVEVAGIIRRLFN